MSECLIYRCPGTNLCLVTPQLIICNQVLHFLGELQPQTEFLTLDNLLDVIVGAVYRFCYDNALPAVRCIRIQCSLFHVLRHSAAGQPVKLIQCA